MKSLEPFYSVLEKHWTAAVEDGYEAPVTEDEADDECKDAPMAEAAVPEPAVPKPAAEEPAVPKAVVPPQPSSEAATPPKAAGMPAPPKGSEAQMHPSPNDPALFRGVSKWELFLTPEGTLPPSVQNEFAAFPRRPADKESKDEWKKIH